MGRSAPSCFKIIACGSDSAATDDLDVSENKGSSDKRGWSFRKRTTQQRVLSNTVISENPSSESKKRPESDGFNFQASATTTGPEKIPQLTDEKSHLSTLTNSKVSENETIAVAENEKKDDVNLEESVVVIQAAVRCFLAQRALLKLKNIVKLQAAVRGHLIRCHALGTLRCVQAIVKIQALVRARRVRMSLQGISTEEKLDGKYGSSNVLGKENAVTKSNTTYVSIHKLLSNRFAQQLLESTPKTKSIHIKCDSSKPNSAWIWLERWMSFSSIDLAQTPKPELIEEHERVEDKISTSRVEDEVPSEIICKSGDVTSISKETAMPSKFEENLITDYADKIDFQACHLSLSSVGDNLERSQPDKAGSSEAKETSLEITSLPDQHMQSDSECQMGLSSLSSKPEMESQQPKCSMKRIASEQLETEGKKFAVGTRKASNPAFIAVQSKFEELSSATNSGRSINLSHQDVGVESNMDTVSPGPDTVFRGKYLNIVEDLVPHNSRPQVGGSECGTELSISSTLDSPDRSEVGGVEYEYEAKVLEEGTCNPSSMKNLGVEGMDASAVPLSDLSQSVSIQSEKLDDIHVEAVDLIDVVDSLQVEHKPEKSSSGLQVELDSETVCHAYRSSPEASPKTHITVPESQGTPSSQVSVKAKSNKAEKSGSNKKGQPSGGKRSPSNNVSGGRNSMEKLPKDQKNGKKNTFFGSPRPDHHDQEPRDSSSSSNSLPHFMQATESARAKLNANNSPRSSPDVLDRDIYVKKRHSLPGANGRQGSPRIQRSMSQAQQNAKGNGTHSHERKWQR